MTAIWKLLFATTCLLIASVPSDAKNLIGLSVAGDVGAIRNIVSGKKCVNVKDGGDVLKFGKSTSNKPGMFWHAGQLAAKYQIGYATLMVSRNGKLHSHVVTVPPESRQLQFSTDKYQC